MKAVAVLFPFDLFGSGGTGQGAELLADALRELLDDNRRERVATRARAYTERVRLRELEFAELAAYQDWRARGRKEVRRVLRGGDWLLWLAGNHLGVLPLYDELVGSEDTLVVQFDAHLDIHHFADCHSELSHGNFLRHCAGPLPPLINVGHRDLLLRPDDIRPYYRATWSASQAATEPDTVVEAIRKASGTARRVFVDVDCDVFDPGHFPAVTQAVPFGLSPEFFLRCLDAAWSDRVAGLALSEFDPRQDRNDRCLATLVWLLEYVLLRRFESER